MYTYKANVIKVVDGDTIDCMIDLGFGIHVKKRVRLYGINTPESRTRNLNEKSVGLYAKHVLSVYIADANNSVTIKTTLDKTGKFGRVLGVIYISGININEAMVENKLAYVYMGGHKPDFSQLVTDGKIISPSEVPQKFILHSTN